jgi:hypothetical protein
MSFTHYFFPFSFREGFRMASVASDLWNVFLELGPHKKGYTLEVPMEPIAMTVESIFRSYSEDHFAERGPNRNELVCAVTESGYQNHMKAICAF